MSPAERGRGASVKIIVWAALFSVLASAGWTEGGRPAWWLWLLPGGGQFALGQVAEGTAYALGTAGLAGWGIAAEMKRGEGEVNAPLVYAQQLYVVSFYSAYRDVSIMAGRITRLDPSPTSSLAVAPFAPRYLLDLRVAAFAVLGCGVNWALAAASRGRRTFHDLARVSYLGSSWDRERGALAYAAYWIPLSYGAGESEEMLFRGILQADWEEEWGETAGWIAASTVFGLAHLTEPLEGESWAGAGFAALAGLYLGWLWQDSGYRLGGPIAAHFWFDVFAGVTVFLADPANNPLGAKVTFNL